MDWTDPGGGAVRGAPVRAPSGQRWRVLGAFAFADGKGLRKGARGAGRGREVCPLVCVGGIAGELRQGRSLPRRARPHLTGLARGGALLDDPGQDAPRDLNVIEGGIGCKDDPDRMERPWHLGDLRRASLDAEEPRLIAEEAVAGTVRACA